MAGLAWLVWGLRLLRCWRGCCTGRLGQRKTVAGSETTQMHIMAWTAKGVAGWLSEKLQSGGAGGRPTAAVVQQRAPDSARRNMT